MAFVGFDRVETFWGLDTSIYSLYGTYYQTRLWVQLALKLSQFSHFSHRFVDSIRLVGFDACNFRGEGGALFPDFEPRWLVSVVSRTAPACEIRTTPPTAGALPGRDTDRFAIDHASTIFL